MYKFIIFINVLVIITFTSAGNSQDIFQAVTGNDPSAVDSLLHHNPGMVHNVDDYGMTPLHAAALHGCMDIVRMLMEKEADIHALSSMGWPPVLYAEFMGHREIADFLKSKRNRSAGVPSTDFSSKFPGQEAPGQESGVRGQFTRLRCFSPAFS